MKKNAALTLIEGSFHPKEAREILTSILSNKIQFHQKKNFSLKERFGKPDENCLKRIAELKNTNDKIQAIITEAERSNKELRISSTIHIDY